MSNQSNQFAPLFEEPGGNVIFLPYDALIADTKSGARKIGREVRKDAIRNLGFNFAGRVKKLVEGHKYPRVPLSSPALPEDEELWCCPVEGPLAKQIAADMALQDSLEVEA